MKINYLHLQSLGMLMLAFLYSSCSNSDQVKTQRDTLSVKVVDLSATSGMGITLDYNGTIQAEKTITLSFQVGGTVTSIPVDAGQYVEKGQLIAKVDEAVYRNQYEAQLAQARLAKESYRRVLEVYNKGSMAEIKMLEAKSKAEQAEAAARATYQNILHTTLTSPVKGYIGNKMIEAGATAGPGVPVAQVLDVSTVQVLVAVPEGEINRFRRGDQARVSIDALGKVLQGNIAETGVLALTGSANYNVKINLRNDSFQLKPGMLCKVHFLQSHQVDSAQGIKVPAQAVQVDEQGRNFVYVVDQHNKAIRKPVETGALVQDGIMLKSGVDAQDKLIVSGFQKLESGSPLHIIK